MVTFNGNSKLIIVDDNVTTLDVQIMYSDWKEWVRLSDNSKYLPAFSVIGGEPIGGGVFIDASYFLLNGWRIRPYEGNHKLDVIGNIYTFEEGEDPFVNTLGNYRVTINVRLSARATKVISGSGVTTQDKNDIIAGIVPTLSTKVDNVSSNVSIMWEEVQDISNVTSNVLVMENNVMSNVQVIKNDVQVIKPEVQNILGLVQHNFRYTDQVYDSNGNMISGKIKLYSTAEDLNSNASPISVYNVNAIYDTNNRLKDYKVTVTS